MKRCKTQTVSNIKIYRRLRCKYFFFLGRVFATICVERMFFECSLNFCQIAEQCLYCDPLSKSATENTSTDRPYLEKNNPFLTGSICFWSSLQNSATEAGNRIQVCSQLSFQNLLSIKIPFFEQIGYKKYYEISNVSVAYFNSLTQ